MKSNRKGAGAQHTYPINGYGSFLNLLTENIYKNGEVWTNAFVSEISHTAEKVQVKIQKDDTSAKSNFDEVIWTGSLCDLLTLLDLPAAGRFQYLDLLLVYCAISKENLLGENIFCSYITTPEINFHRISEPKKICPTTVPKGMTSVCLEITLDRTMNTDIDEVAEQSLAALCKVFSLKQNQVSLLGFTILPNAYPVLFPDYRSQLLEVHKSLNEKYSRIHIAGKLPNYRHLNIEQTIGSAINTCNQLLTKKRQ